MADTTLVTMTISELAPKIKAKAISPVELTEAVLAQVDRLQPTLNSFITILHEQARRQAREQEAALMRGEYRGPLHGIAIGIKDNIATAGMRTTVGSKVFTDYVPEEDAYVVSRCKKAGAIMIGKENLEEFAAGSTSNNLHYGAVHNPWNLDHIPGGSSGGGGANVAACVTFASLGTDLGGSVRGPAIAALEALGVEAREVALPSMQYAGALRIAGMADSVVTHEPYLRTHRDDYGPTVLYRTLAGQFVLGRDYSKALKVQRLIKEEYARVLQDVDFLVTPAAPVAAWRIDTETVVLGGQVYPVRGPGAGMTARCTSPSNATGLPAMSIPCGFTRAGLPIGLQLIGCPFDEARLFQVAHGYEAVAPSRQRRPPLVEAGYKAGRM